MRHTLTHTKIFFFCGAWTFSPHVASNWVARRRSSAVPHSLLVVDSSSGHNWCLFPPDGTVLEDVVDRLFRFFAFAECRVHDANSLQLRSQATVSCSQPEHGGMLMSCQMVGWVSRGVVVSNGFFPLIFLSVSEQGFGFLVSGGGHGLQIQRSISWDHSISREEYVACMFFFCDSEAP